MKSKNFILLVVNPIAGDSDKEHIIDLVKKECAVKKYRLEIYNTTGHKDTENINSLIKKIRPWRLLVAGGDGTISLVASCLLETDSCLGILPSGSANGLAVNFDLPQTLPEQLNVALSNCTILIDVLSINDNICLHIADLGINAELVKNYENSGIRGKLGYLLQSIPTLLNSDSPFEYTIETTEGTTTETGILLAIANANKFGTGANINPNGKLNDGKFEILIFKSLDVIEIFKTMRDKPDMSSDFVHVISSSEAKISCKKNIPFQIDGEFIGNISYAHAKIKKETLKIAVPEMFNKLYKT